jgi:nucleotide-binding universal stress UspA family protein
MTAGRTVVPFVDSILHATDFSEASRPAFAYALVFSLIRQTKLTLLYVGDDHLGIDGWTKFPPVRKTLERWGLLEPGSRKADVFDAFAVRVKKVAIRDSRPARAVVEYLEEDPADLLVLGTEGREGLPRWMEPSIAEAAAEKSGAMTLFVSDEARGFVSPDTGNLALRRILVPVAPSASSETAITMATRAARAAQAEDDTPVQITLLHVGSDKPIAPRLEDAQASYCAFEVERREGDVVDEIIAAAEEKRVELIVMTTRGRNSLIDAVRGSKTQQVLRRSPCTLLAVPIGR